MISDNNTYWIWENNFNGTENQYEVKNGVINFMGIIEWVSSEGIDPDKHKGIAVNINSNDSAETVALKTEQAIKRALPELEKE